MSSETTSNVQGESSPMTPMERRKFGEMGTRMKYFHDYFKSHFEEIYQLADGKFYDRGMTLHTFLESANQFKKHLEGHHNIEESYIFPILARKMPAFRVDEQHRTKHKQIHAGLDALHALITKVRENPSSYSPADLRACLDSFREPLMTHLDEEVEDLAAENMRKYWTLEELKQIPM